MLGRWLILTALLPALFIGPLQAESLKTPDKRGGAANFVTDSLSSLQMDQNAGTLSPQTGDDPGAWPLSKTPSDVIRLSCGWCQQTDTLSDPAPTNDPLTLPIAIVLILGALELTFRSQAYREFYDKIFGPPDLY
jgi:hypothetical protein